MSAGFRGAPRIPAGLTCQHRCYRSPGGVVLRSPAAGCCGCERPAVEAGEAELVRMRRVAKVLGSADFADQYRQLSRQPQGHVAQLDRASDSGSEGRGFESLHARDSSGSSLYRSLKPMARIPPGSRMNPCFFKPSSAIAGAEIEMLHPGSSFFKPARA